MKETFFKKMPWWLTYPTLVVFAFSIFATWTYFYVPRMIFAEAQGLPRPFEGNISYIEWNCLCSGSIMWTITPTTAWGLETQGPSINIMYYWAADAFSHILGGILDLPIPGPRIYMNYMVFTEGDQVLLGNYFPMSVPCVAYVGSACSVTGYAQGVSIGVGTSLY